MARDENMKVLLARSIHSFVSSYLLSVARVFGNKALHDYVNQIVRRRKEAAQSCRYLQVRKEGLVLRKKKYRYVLTCMRA
jgi:hypothetical protein